MRDPIGRVDVTTDGVIRTAYAPLPFPHFLDSPAAAELVERGLLTPFELEGRSVIRARKVGFATFPWEWTHAQFLQAANLTLDIAEAALSENQELKDASAFNILFERDQPEFCDHFSVQPIRRREWWAYGQFLRHFLFPLAASRHRDMEPADVFKASLDGLAPESVRKLLGAKRWSSRIGIALLQSSGGSSNGSASPVLATGPVKSLHKGLIDFLRWQLAGLRRAPRASMWASYETTRSHYQATGLERKREIVARWLSGAAPTWVADLGCNQGEFSLIAAGIARAGVIAVDADMPAIEHLRTRLTADTPIYTVCAGLDDLPAGRGWMGREYRGLPQRLGAQADVTMALALIHHLAIGRSIPLPEVAELMAAATRRHLIVEYVEPQDPMVQELLVSRDRADGAGFTLEAQRRAFETRFRTIEEVALEGSPRRLALLEKL
jgi:SAM-dependent methyltransferase